jgi:hypothetical protein
VLLLLLRLLELSIVAAADAAAVVCVLAKQEGDNEEEDDDDDEEDGEEEDGAEFSDLDDDDDEDDDEDGEEKKKKQKKEEPQGKLLTLEELKRWQAFALQVRRSLRPDAMFASGSVHSPQLTSRAFVPLPHTGLAVWPQAAGGSAAVCVPRKRGPDEEAPHQSRTGQGRG